MIMGVCFASLLMGCEAHQQEQEVLSVVNDGIALLEDGAVGKTMRLTTRDFLVQPGKLSRIATSRKLMSFFNGRDDIQILHPAPDVALHESGDSALVSMPFVVARSGVEVRSLAALEDDPDAWTAAASELTRVQHIELSLVKTNDRWLVRTVRFK